MLKDMYGNYYCITREEASSKLLKYCHLLDPLRKLKGIADNVKVRGELPQALIDEFTNILSVPVADLGPVAKKNRDLSKAEKKRKEEVKRPGPGCHDFMKEMAEKYAGTEEEQFYRDCLKSSCQVAGCYGGSVQASDSGRVDEMFADGRSSLR